MFHVLQTPVSPSGTFEALGQALRIAVNGSRTGENLATIANTFDQVAQLASRGSVNASNDEVNFLNVGLPVGPTLK